MSKNHISTRCEWAHKIELWKQSGKSARAWCRENQLVYTTFLGWNTRLEKSQNVIDSSTSLKTQFIELKDNSKISPGISLECEGVMIHLNPDFDVALLKKCLTALRSAPC